MSQRTRGAIIVIVAVALVLASFVTSAIATADVRHKANRAESALIQYLSQHSESQLAVVELDLTSGHDAGLPKNVSVFSSTSAGGIQIREQVSVLWASRCVTATRDKAGAVSGTTRGSGCL